MYSVGYSEGNDYYDYESTIKSVSKCPSFTCVVCVCVCVCGSAYLPVDLAASQVHHKSWPKVSTSLCSDYSHYLRISRHQIQIWGRSCQKISIIIHVQIFDQTCSRSQQENDEFESFDTILTYMICRPVQTKS